MKPSTLAPKSVRRLIRRSWAYANYVREFLSFRELSQRQRQEMPVRWSDRYPCLDDRTETTGFDRHYVYHTAWAARIVAQLRPELHIDVSSSLYFASLVAAFVPVRFLDYRPANLHLRGLTSEAGDLLALPFADASVPSISCMHVVEHVGLGRYGDPLDPEGDLKAMAELQRVVAPGGSLLFVTPVGKPCIRYNAHRIYSARFIVERFGRLKLKQFALIPDREADGGLVLDADLDMADRQTYGCGCFWFQASPSHSETRS